jgi:ribonuclease J
VQLAIEAGLMQLEPGQVIPQDLAHTVRSEQLLVLAAGAQGEPRSALSNMLNPDPGPLRARAGDLLRLSSRVIPGNELLVADLIDRFVARGVKVLHAGIEPLIHVSGHAARDEQRKLIHTVRPRAFVPVHGERRQLAAHLDVAQEAGVGTRLLAVDGDVFGLDDEGLSSLRQVPAGRVLSWRDSDDELSWPALEERRELSNGIIFVCLALNTSSGRVVAGPSVSGRGLSVEESAALSLAEANAKEALEALGPLRADDAKVREELKEAVRRSLRQSAGSRATVVPLVLKV